MALLGCPSTNAENKSAENKPVPPSLVVGGIILRSSQASPFIVVYDLGVNAAHLSVNEDSGTKPSDDFYTSSGSTGMLSSLK